MLNTLREYDEGSLDGSCQCPLAGAVTISVPYDMNLPNKALGTAFGRLVYDKRFVQGLMPKIEAFLSRCGGGQSSFPKRLVSCSDDILAFPAASPLDITTSSLTSWRSLLLCHSLIVQTSLVDFAGGLETSRTSTRTRSGRQRRCKTWRRTSFPLCLATSLSPTTTGTAKRLPEHCICVQRPVMGTASHSSHPPRIKGVWQELCLGTA